MTKFVPAIIAIAAMSTLAGCVAETGDVASEQVDETAVAACDNREGTNAMLALLANAMGKELGRWEVLSDFNQIRGYNYQAQLQLKSTAVCAAGSNGCQVTKWLLSYQDSRLNNRFVMDDGTKVDSWNFASRLVTGYDNMKTYKQNNMYKYDAHKLSFQSSVPGACDMLNTFGITKPDGSALTVTQTQNVRNALRFMEGNGPNPYIAFSSTATTVTMDPGLPGETGTGTGTTYGCTKFQSTTASPQLAGASCTCAGIAAPSTLKRQTTNPATPNTYYCTSPTGQF